jgi:hypothetical protein
MIGPISSQIGRRPDAPSKMRAFFTGGIAALIENKIS